MSKEPKADNKKIKIKNKTFKREWDQGSSLDGFDGGVNYDKKLFQNCGQEPVS